MKIVIDIPKEAYEAINYAALNGRERNYGYLAIANGTPLPKGHGRLIDADKLSAKAMLYAPRDFDGLFMDVQDLRNAPTILEADKEVDDGT